jgi:hypothetical protein
MAEIPDEFRRVLEKRIDEILQRHLSAPSHTARVLFSEMFGSCDLRSIERARLPQYCDYREDSGDPLAHGQTDIEVVAHAIAGGHQEQRLALLIENKVDSGQMAKQGLRYRARAQYRQQLGDWDDFRCALIAPRSYLDAAYSVVNHRDHGWDGLVSYEDVAEMLKKEAQGRVDADILLEATTSANTWNKPIPSAVQFWVNYEAFGRSRFPDIPVLAKTERGSRIGGVWPSFYDPQLRANRSRPERKRVQIVHMDTATYVCLFLKKVSFSQRELAKHSRQRSRH